MKMTSISDHPKMLELLQQGVDRPAAERAFSVYLSLVEVKRWWGVTMETDPTFKQVILSGYPHQGEPREYFLPVSCKTPLSMNQFDDYLCQFEEKYDINSLNLALVDGSGEVEYHRITSGLVPPDPPELQELKKQERERKFQKKYVKFVRSEDL